LSSEEIRQQVFDILSNRIAPDVEKMKENRENRIKADEPHVTLYSHTLWKGVPQKRLPTLSIGRMPSAISVPFTLGYIAQNGDH
jgi:hypothetical protein